MSPEEFARHCRRFLGKADNDSFNQIDLEQLSRALDLVPVAFYNPGMHWTVLIRATNEGIKVYDPVNGIKDVPNDQIREAVYYFAGNRKDAVMPYSLRVEPFIRLGRIQTDAVNCGPLAVYAARLAKRG